MADQATPDEQLQQDVTLGFSYAINADLMPDPDEAEDQTARLRREQELQERRANYARDLLYELSADPDRLLALAEACRAQDRPGYATAALLADLALEEIRRAEREAGQEGRQKLLAELQDERHWSPPAYVQRFWHRHSSLRRLLRRASPLWWLRRLDAKNRVSTTYGPYSSEFQQMTILLDGEDIGAVIFGVCDQCRLGYVAKINVEQTYQGRGIGGRALQELRERVPGYRWATSGQRRDAKSFWKLTARQSKRGYEAAEPCRHISPHTTREEHPREIRR